MPDTENMRRTPFPATAWTQIEAAKGDSDSGRAAFAAWCEVYWQPAFGVIARRVSDLHKAKDLTQEFFAELLVKRTLIEKADRSRGKFRSFLSQRLKWFVLDRVKKEIIERRGLEKYKSSSHRKLTVSDEDDDPEFNLDWARRTLKQALDRLEDKYEAEGKVIRRDILKQRRAQVAPADIAIALKMKIDQLKNEMRAIRADTETSLKVVIKATVNHDSLVNEEFEFIKTNLASVRGPSVSPQSSPEPVNRDS